MFPRLTSLLAFLGAAVAAAQPVDPPLVTLLGQAHEIACGPRVLFAPPAPALRLTGGLDHHGRSLFGTGDVVTLDRGAADGVTVDQRYALRRTGSALGLVGRPDGHALFLQTSGWVRVTAVQPEMATAVVEYACLGVQAGDYLEPFAMPEVPMPQPPGGAPDVDGAATVLFGVEARRTIGSNELLVIDRGSDHGLEPGLRFLILRQVDGVNVQLAEASVLEVRPDSSMLRVLGAQQAIHSGDTAVPLRRR